MGNLNFELFCTKKSVNVLTFVKILTQRCNVIYVQVLVLVFIVVTWT